MSRFYEKISFEQFAKDAADNMQLYDKSLMPKRKTVLSAVYDFFVLYDYILKPGDILKIPTGIKCSIKKDDGLLLIDRNSMVFKYNVRMRNQVV